MICQTIKINNIERALGVSFGDDKIFPLRLFSFKNNIMKTRHTYFMIFYIGHNTNGRVYGNCALKLRSKFPNRIEVSEYIKHNYELIDMAITNIIQLTKSQYEEWSNK